MSSTLWKIDGEKLYQYSERYLGIGARLFWKSDQTISGGTAGRSAQLRKNKETIEQKCHVESG